MTSATPGPAEGSGDRMTPARLLEALEQWNGHDVDAVMRYFADECEYHASFGSTPKGESYLGREAVREGVRKFFEAFPDGRFEDTTVAINGTKGSAEWNFVSTNSDGEEVSVHGCDLFEFDGSYVKSKNAFRKVIG